MRAKHIVFLVVFCVFLVNSAQAGFLDIGIFTDTSFSDAETTVVFDVNNPGTGSFDFWTVVNTDLPISGLEYNVTFPTVGWTLNNRAYNPDSWIVSEDLTTLDGLLNNSIPLPGNIDIGVGVEITEALYTDLDPDFAAALDFHFSSRITNDGEIAKGTDVFVERFNVDLPLNIALGDYSINLENIMAFDLAGNSVLQFGDFTAINPNVKNLNLSVIPEPGALTLFLITLFGINSIRSRRKKRLV